MDSVRCVLGLLLLIIGDVSCHRTACSLNPLNVSACFMGITEAINGIEDINTTRPFIPANFVPSVYIDVQIVTTAINYEVCCENYTDEGKTQIVDPTSSHEVAAVSARTDSTQTFTLIKDGNSFTGDIHTIIMVDPDPPFPDKGTFAKPILHMLMTNIKDGDIASADVLMAYTGPRPPNDLPHYYYYLVYTQPAESTFTITEVQEGYTTGCERCLFDILKFVPDKDLTLVGISWMVVSNSPYVDYVWITAGSNSSLYCSDTPGWVYGEECTNAAPYEQATLSMCFTLVLVVFIKTF